ncbi:MAG: hypothetical protein RR643_05060 [Anaerorhabdus sp.]|uniref:hypothetical protein n=1 Tax=Anaerorhabdus sp. TaxID=1872524 RepID=UPI002FC9315A
MAKKPETIFVPDEEIVKVRKNKPAMDPEMREKQLINKAVNLVEKQLDDGTASSAVLVHYLKLATKRENLEREILEKQAKLIAAKTDTIDNAKDSKELMSKAIDAMKQYSPGG